MRKSSLTLHVVNVGIYAFILAPVVVIMAIAFSGTESVEFPPTSFSLRWFQKFASDSALVSSLMLSLVLAVSSSFISLVLGGMAAFGIARGKFRGRSTILQILTMPLMVPTLVVAIAFLEYFAALGFASFPSLLLGHIVITVPYVLRTMIAGLSGIDMLAEKAAISLGASRFQAIRQITLPMLSDSAVAAVLFSFIISFENLPVALFLSDYNTVTLPMQIYSYIEWVFDPTVAAASAVQVLVVILLVFLAERMIGLRRLMSAMR